METKRRLDFVGWVWICVSNLLFIADSGEHDVASVIIGIMVIAN